jgi:hypothetical protein
MRTLYIELQDQLQAAKDNKLSVELIFNQHTTGGMDNVDSPGEINRFDVVVQYKEQRMVFSVTDEDLQNSEKPIQVIVDFFLERGFRAVKYNG